MSKIMAVASMSKPAHKQHNSPKAFDIFRPGKMPSSPTSRPIITGHKPAVKDVTITDKPRMTDVGDDTDEQKKPPMMDPHDKVNVEPEAHEAGPQDEVVPAETTETSESADLEELVLQSDDDKADAPIPPEEPATQDEEPAAEAEAQPDALPPAESKAETVPQSAPEPDEQPKPADSPDAELHAASANIESPAVPLLTAETATDPADDIGFNPDKVVVSHHRKYTRFRWLKRLFITLVVVALVAAAIDAVLDARIWKPGFNIPHTNLIKNKS
jgi:hypothetical protein